MAILGIDYGAKKIGLARSDETETMALPLEVLANTGHEAVLQRINSICAENDITKIVVGVPVSFSRGAAPTSTTSKAADLENQQMQEVLAFVEWLKKNTSLPVEIEDERLSTKMANRLNRDLVNHGPDDAVAAMLVLQNYLDKKNH